MRGRRVVVGALAIAACGALALANGAGGHVRSGVSTLGDGWLTRGSSTATTRGDDRDENERVLFEDAADGGLIDSQYEDDTVRELETRERRRRKSVFERVTTRHRRDRGMTAAKTGRANVETRSKARTEPATLGDTYINVYDDGNGGASRGGRPQRYRTVTVPVPTRIRVPMEPASVGPEPRTRPQPAPKPPAPPKHHKTPVSTEEGDLFGLGTGYTYYVDPGDWVYPPRSVVELPDGVAADMELLARGDNENTASRAGLILRVNGSEKLSNKAIVRNGDVVEVDAQSHNVVNDVRTVVLRYNWRDPGAGGVRKQRRGLVRISNRRDAGTGESQPMRWPIVEHADVPSAKSSSPAVRTTDANRGQYVDGGGSTPQYVPVTVNIYADVDDDDDDDGSPSPTPSVPTNTNTNTNTNVAAPKSPPPPVMWPPPPAYVIERRDVLSAEKLVVPTSRNMLMGLPTDDAFVVSGLPDFNSDNTHYRELIRFRFGWTANGASQLGASNGDSAPATYVEPSVMDTSTTPPDWISIRVNGQLRPLPYAAQNGDHIILRIRAPAEENAGRVVQMLIGDLHPKVILTTANIHAPPSLDETMDAMEPPAPPSVPSPPPRESIPPPPPRIQLQAPPSPPMPDAPSANAWDDPYAAPNDDGSYYDNGGDVDTTSNDDGSYYDNGGSSSTPAQDDGSYYDNGGSSSTPAQDDGSYYDNGGSSSTPAQDDGSYYDNGGSSSAHDDGSYYDNGGSSSTPAQDDGSYYDNGGSSSTPAQDDGSYYDNGPTTPNAAPAQDDGSYYDNVDPSADDAASPVDDSYYSDASPSSDGAQSDGSYYDDVTPPSDDSSGPSATPTPSSPTPTPTPTDSQNDQQAPASSTPNAEPTESLDQGVLPADDSYAAYEDGTDTDADTSSQNADEQQRHVDPSSSYPVVVDSDQNQDAAEQVVPPDAPPTPPAPNAPAVPPAPSTPPPPHTPPAPPTTSTTNAVVARAGTRVPMFYPHKTIESLQAPNQPCTLLFMQGDVSYDARPSWAHVFKNEEELDDVSNVTLSNGDTIRIGVDASEAPGAERVAFAAFGHKQFTLKVTTAQPSPPPPASPSPPPEPIEIVLGRVAGNRPRECTSAEAYKWSTLTTPDRSSVASNAWCARNTTRGERFEAPLCASTKPRDVVIIVDASEAVGREVFYGRMIDMLHDLYCAIENSGSQVGVLLLPGSNNPYVCDAYTSYIPLQKYSSEEFHNKLEALRNDESACCGRSVPLAQGFKAAAGLFRDFGRAEAADRSVILLTSSLPSTPIEAETCSMLSVPEFKEMTRDFPYNTLESGEDMTACQYRMRSVHVAAAELKLSGARVSVINVPGASGAVPPSAYYAGSPWPSSCSDDGVCSFTAPYGGTGGGWGEWYADSNGALTRDYQPGPSKSCDISVAHGAPIVSKPILTNALRVSTWNPNAYKDTVAIAMCPTPACLTTAAARATLADACPGDSASDWTRTKSCLHDATYAVCDRLIPRTAECHGESSVSAAQTGQVDGQPAFAVTITCRQRCGGERTQTRARRLYVVCVHGRDCDTEINDWDENYPASSSQYPASSTQYPASSTQYPSSSKYPATSTQYPANRA
jgi:hypothetical protein